MAPGAGMRRRPPPPQPRRTGALLVALAAALAVTMPAAAQAQQALGESVTGRPRPEFTPIGLELDDVLCEVGLIDKRTHENKSSPLASFIVHPTTEAAVTYDSNIFRTENGAQSDEIFNLRPSLQIASDWVNHEAHLGLSGDIGRHLSHATEDYENYRFDGGGRIDVTDSLTATGNAAASRTQVPRGTPDNPGGPTTSPMITDAITVHGDARYQPDAILLAARLDRADYTNSGGDPVTTPDGDRVETTVAVRTGYEFSPGTTAYIEPSYNTRDYARRIDSSGLLQGSHGVRIEAGLTYDATAQTFFEIGVGYLRQSFDEPSFATIGGPSISGRLLWNPTALVTVIGNVVRRVDETTTPGVSGILVTEGTIGVDYEYLDNLIVSMRGSYSDQEYQGGPQRTDTLTNGTVSLNYSIGSRWYARLEVGVTRRDSTIAGSGYTDQTMTLALGEHL